jgi:GGDEF domain-containing protein
MITMAIHFGSSNGSANGENERLAESPPAVPTSVYEAGRSLLRINLASEAVAVLTRVIRELGGETALDGAAAEGSTFVECRLRESQSLRAIAPEGTPALRDIQKYLPQLVEDARYILQLKSGAEQLARHAGIDPLTGLPDHYSMSRLLSRLTEGDIIIAIELSDPLHLTATPRAECSDELLRAFSRVLRQSARETDHLGRMPMGRGFIVVLRKAGPEAAYRLLDRLQSAWEMVRPAEVNVLAGIATTSAGGWRPAMLAAESALQRATQPEADGRATATGSDFDIVAEESALSGVTGSREEARDRSAPEPRATNPSH